MVCFSTNLGFVGKQESWLSGPEKGAEEREVHDRRVERQVEVGGQVDQAKTLRVCIEVDETRSASLDGVNQEEDATVLVEGDFAGQRQGPLGKWDQWQQEHDDVDPRQNDGADHPE